MPNPKLTLLEANHLWPDFHATFLNYWREFIADVLPEYYEARIGAQVTLVRSDGNANRFGPDVSIVRSQSIQYNTNAESSATTVLLDHLEIEESFLKPVSCVDGIKWHRFPACGPLFTGWKPMPFTKLDVTTPFRLD